MSCERTAGYPEHVFCLPVTASLVFLVEPSEWPSDDSDLGDHWLYLNVIPVIDPYKLMVNSDAEPKYFSQL